MLTSDFNTKQVNNILNKISFELLQDAEVDTSVYEEIPVDINTFISSPKYLNADKYVYPVVKNDLVQIFAGNYTEAILLEGIGSGKSFSAALAITYMVYRTLCLRDPQSYYPGLSPDSKITFMNMSTSATQAKKIVFGKISFMIRNCIWFKDRNYLPDPKKTSELEFPKNIYVLPGSSSETAPLGYDLLGAVMDEAAFMVDTDTSNKASAEGGIHNVAGDIFDSLKQRIESRFLNKGLIIIISSPRYKGDFISAKYAESKSDTEIYARRRATFDCKPKSFYSGKRFVIDLEKKNIVMCDGHIIFTDDSTKVYKNKKINLTIPIEHIKLFKRNFTKALRDYCAIASRAVDPYILNYMLWKEIAEASKLQHPFTDGRFAPWFKGDGRISYVHVDLATGKEGRDSCGIALACIDPKDLSKIQIPFKEGLRAPIGEEIQFSKIREIIVTLRDLGFDIRLVTYDGWNSIDSRQILEKQGFETDYLSMDRTLEPYETLKESVTMRKVDFYNHLIFLEEIEGLELIEGKKVDHPPNGCFIGGTLISLCDGRDLSILNLLKEQSHGKINYIYSIDQENKLVSRKIKKIWETKKVNTLIKITLDNDASILCTPEHLFMNRDGFYRQAKDLSTRESLMPLYRKYPRIQKRITMGVKKNHIEGKYKNAYTALQRCNNKQKGKKRSEKDTIAIKDGIIKYNRFRKLNHKVKNIEIINVKETPVYDLEVENGNNFALSAGVFVHNSKDIADSVAGAVYTLITHPPEDVDMWVG